MCFQTEVDRNIELLKKKDEELTEALEKMENQSENNDIDDVIVPTAPLYKQILNLYAEENAIEDTIFYLGEALRRGVIDLEVFLKVASCFSIVFIHLLLLYLLHFFFFFRVLFRNELHFWGLNVLENFAHTSEVLKIYIWYMF